VLDLQTQFPALLHRAEAEVRKAFPIVAKSGRRLEASGWRWTHTGDDVRDDFALHKRTKLRDGTLSAKLIADLKLIDVDGKSIDGKEAVIVLTVPHATAKGSFIVDGKELQVVNQLRLRPGLYTRFTVDDDVETFVNTSAAGTYRVVLERQRGRFFFRVGPGAHYALTTVLRCLGISDGEMIAAWGRKIFDATQERVADDDEALKLFAKLRSTQPPPASAAEARRLVGEFLQSKPLDPDVNRITLGTAFERVDGRALLASSVKCLALAQGKTEPDDPESLSFKSIHSVEDFVGERLTHAVPGVVRAVAFKLDRAAKVTDAFHADMFSEPVRLFFAASEFSRHADQNNPVEMAGLSHLTTVMGEGGIQSPHAIRDEVRLVHPSHLGVLDPIKTPEGMGVGVTGSLALGAKKIGTRIYVPVIDAKTGRRFEVTVEELERAVVAFPDQYDVTVKPPRPLKASVKGRLRLDFREFKPAEVQFILPDAKLLFGPTTSIIPFLSSDDGNRAGMADRHVEQTVPLKNPDKPLVQAKFGPVGYEELFGTQFLPRAPVAGVVEKIDKDGITLRAGRTRHRVPLHDHYPLNTGTYLHDTPCVKVGDKVEAGQRLSDNNFTRDGSLALGANLRTGYFVYKGLTFEDGVVVSESAAKKLTSLHKYDLRLETDKTVRTGLNRLLAQFPEQIKAVHDRTKYDEDGVVKPGALLQPDELAVAAVREAQYHADYDYARLHKALSHRWSDASICWDGAVPGKVLDVVKTPSFIRVVVATEEPAQIGDKISARHGNKAILACVLPDGEMPHTADGKPLDLLMSPAALPGRVNPGQLYEAAAGEVAQKTGKTYLVDNFERDHQDTLETVKRDRRLAGLNEYGEQEVTDPISGRVYGRVQVGPLHVLKLRHSVAKKFSARGAGPSYTINLQPSKTEEGSAQRIGGLELYALLSGDATKFVDDAFKIKGQKNDEYWRAVQLGLPPPRPMTPFVSEKFLSYLTGAGIDLTRDGDVITAGPLTDQMIRAASNGKIDNPSVVDANTLKPEKGGLFDPAITGGMGGKLYSHIELAEPIVHPLMLPAAATVAGVSAKELSGLIDGSLGFKNGGVVANDGSLPSGVEAIEGLLKKIDLDAELKKVEAGIKTTASLVRRDKLHKRRRYLLALKAAGLRPETAYINRTVPVIPAMFRAVYPLPDGALNVSDPVHGYREVMIVSAALKQLKDLGVVGPRLGKARADLHAAVGGLVGTVEPLTRAAHFKGFLQQIKGVQNKSGFFQGRVMSRPQDLSARSTIVPDPQLHLDDMGLPQEMGLTIYKPFLIRRLTMLGHKPLVARKMVEDKHPLALKALEMEVKERPVLLNRAPSLHKFNVLAFHPRITQGQAISITPLVVKGFNADFDGDANLNAVLIKINERSAHKCDTLWSQVLLDAILTGDHVTARFGVTLPLADGDRVAAVDLADFPKGELLRTTQGEQGLINHYSVPEGIEVLAYDERERRVAWRPATEWSEHPERRVVTVTLKSGYQLLTDEDPRAVYGVSAGSLVPMRCFPSQAVELRMLVPRAAKLTEMPAGGLGTWAVPAAVHLQSGDQRRALNNHIPLSDQVGHLFGALVGNGWASGGSQVCLSDMNGEVADAIDAALPSLFEQDVPTRGEVERAGPTGGGYGASRRHVWSSAAFCRLTELLIGKGAHHKHLPPFFLMAVRGFRLGLLAGLIDTDGSVSVSNGKTKPQTLLNYSTVSERLAREIVLLSRSLGIKARITTAKTPADAPCYVLNFTVADAVQTGLAAQLRVMRKRELLCSTNADANSPSAAAQDIVPITPEIATAVMKALRARPDRDVGPTKSLYVTASRARADGYLSRTAAERMLTHIDADPTWRAVVCNRDVTWDLVESVEQTELVETGYDLTVPGFETFMSIDGVILSNTMGVHVPVTEEARREALDKLLPSKNMLSPADDRVMHVPTNETVLGLYLMTTPVGEPRRAASVAAMVQQYVEKKAQANTAFRIGEVVTCPGQAVLNEMLPAKLRVHEAVTGKVLTQLIARIVSEYSPQAADLISKLKDLGNHYSTEIGFSVSLRDLSINKPGRDKILAEARRQTPLLGFEQASLNAVKQIGDMVHADKRNRFVQLTSVSGALGKSSQVTRMLGAPVAVMDHRGRAVPVQIGKSYAEGFDLGSYWATMPGVRKGLMDKGLSTADTGYLTKLLVQANIENTISEADCGTSEGLQLPADDADLVGRYLASGKDAGKPITADLQRRLQAAGNPVTVRSPLKCRSARGICQRCFGDSPEGKPYPIGYHLGVLAAQTIGEPSTQLSLKCSAAESLMAVRHAGVVSILTMQELWERQTSPIATEEGVDFRSVGGWETWDGERWTPVFCLERHLPTAPMLMQRLSSGQAVVAQADHPAWVKRKPVFCRHCGGSFTRLYAHMKGKAFSYAKCDDCGECTKLPRAEASQNREEVVELGQSIGSFVLTDHVEPTPGIEPPVSGYLAGIFLAEGTFAKYHSPSPKKGRTASGGPAHRRHSMRACDAAITQNPGRIKDRIHVELRRAGISFTAKTRMTRIKVDFEQWADWFGRYSRDRGLPGEWLSAPISWLQDFIAGVLDGDGCTSGGQLNIDSTSRKLVFQLAYIAQRLGGGARLIDTPWRALSRHQGYRVELLLPKQRLPSEKPVIFKPCSSSRRSYQEVALLKPVVYEGHVYDAKTASATLMLNGVRTHNSFHMGGSIGSRAASGFHRVNQLFTLPENVPGKAVLAMDSGVVTEIKPATTGGWNVRIGMRDHYVPAEAGLAVGLRQRVSAGDRISRYGVLRPQDLLEATGDIGRVRDEMIKELGGSFKDSGVRIKRRVFETTLKPMTDRARVVDPGGSSDVVIGDVLPTNRLDALNQKLKQPIKYEPLLLGIIKIPQYGDDFIGRMMHERMIDTMRDAASKGQQANMGPQGHPVTRLALTNLQTQVGLPHKNRPTTGKASR